MEDGAAVWQEHKTPEGDIYYYNTHTGESIWERPAILGPATDPAATVSIERLTDGWLKIFMQDANYYYFNKDTGQSSWELPTVPAESIHQPTDEEKGTSQPSKSISVALPQQPAVLETVKRKLGDVAPEPAPSFDSTTLPNKRFKPDESRPADEHSQTQLATNQNVAVSENENSEQGIALFTEMLREKKLTPFSSWEKELPKLCFDPRFKALPKHSDRRAVFDNYVKNLMREDRHSKIEKSKSLIAALQEAASRHASELEGSLSFSAFRRITAEEDVWKRNADSKELRALYYTSVAPLLKEEHEQKQKQKEQVQNEFLQLLRETRDISPDSKWQEIENLIVEDARYKAVIPTRRERIFTRYVQGLSADYQREQRRLREEASFREREREVRATRDRESREMGEHRRLMLDETARAQFNTLLSEKIKDHNMHWREGREILRTDKRYADSPLGSSDKEDLFRKHTKKLLEDIYAAFRALLVETDQIDFVTPWAVAKKMISNDPRFQRVPTETDKEQLFEEHLQALHNTAKNDFKELLSETKMITAKTALDDPKFDKIESLLRGDKRYKRLDCKPSERLQILEEYIEGLKARKEEV